MFDLSGFRDCDLTFFWFRFFVCSVFGYDFVPKVFLILIRPIGEILIFRIHQSAVFVILWIIYGFIFRFFERKIKEKYGRKK